MWNPGLDEAQAGIEIAERNINNLRYTNDTTLMAESEELKNLLMKVKEESENVGLKLNIQKTKIMASDPINSRQMDGETMETVRDYFFVYGGGAPKSLNMVTVAMKLRHLLLGRKAMTNPDSILKSRDITLSTKVHLAKAMVFFLLKFIVNYLVFRRRFLYLNAGNVVLWCRVKMKVKGRERRRQVLLVSEYMRGLGLRADDGQQEKRRNVFF